MKLKRDVFMNIELKNILTQITSEHGDIILSEPKRISSFLSDLARDVPKPQKTALIKSLEHGFAKILKDVPAPERNVCLQKLSQKLNEEEGLELKLCEETLELLVEVLFGEKLKKKDNLCTNCGKELQNEWLTCPYCLTPAVKPNQIKANNEQYPANQAYTEIQTKKQELPKFEWKSWLPLIVFLLFFFVILPIILTFFIN